MDHFSSLDSSRESSEWSEGRAWERGRFFGYSSSFFFLSSGKVLQLQSPLLPVPLPHLPRVLMIFRYCKEYSYHPITAKVSSDCRRDFRPGTFQKITDILEATNSKNFSRSYDLVRNKDIQYKEISRQTLTIPLKKWRKRIIVHFFSFSQYHHFSNIIKNFLSVQSMKTFQTNSRTEMHRGCESRKWKYK